MDEVLEAAVVLKGDEVYGEVPIAYVVPRPGRALHAADLRPHCLSRLAKFKVPREYVILPDLSKNSVGKIMKPELRTSDLVSSRSQLVVDKVAPASLSSSPDPCTMTDRAHTQPPRSHCS